MGAMSELAPCLREWLWWWPLALVALVALRQLCRLRLRRVGPPVPGLASLRALLDDDGAYRGVAVREEPPGPFGGGRVLRRDGAPAEIRLEAGMLERRDVEALAVLAHERAHLARDLPFPPGYRRAVLAAAAVGLAAALGQPRWAEIGTLLAWVAFAVACAHVLHDELAASEAAMAEIVDRGLPVRLWLAALVRLGAAFAVYLAEWGLIAAALYLVTAVARCR